MGKTKYLVRVEHYCSVAREASPGEWVVLESETRPETGVIDRKEFASGVMPAHSCKRYYSSDICDSDSTCNWQEIVLVKDLSQEEAARLNARVVSSLGSNLGKLEIETAKTVG